MSNCDDRQSAKQQAAPCHIDRLPSEILHHILSSIRSRGDIKHPDYDAEFISTIFRLRWVSRRFRRIATELDFWLDDDFDFYFEFEKIAERVLKPRIGNDQLRTVRYVQILLNDDYLLHRLQKKSGWKFSGIEMFLVFLVSNLHVPSIAERVTMVKMEEALPVALGQLADFNVLKELVIENVGNMTIDLSSIAKFQLLEKLKILDAWRFTGTLAKATRMESFAISFDSRAICNIDDLALSLPSGSPQSLTSLSIKFFKVGWDYFYGKSFDPFINLKSLSIHFVTPELCYMLRDAKFSLNSLEAWVFSDSNTIFATDKSVLTMLTAPSLQSLKNLKFNVGHVKVNKMSEIHDEKVTLEILDPIVSAITQLCELETLTLEMGLRLSWLERFGRLRNLKRLHYKIKFDDFDPERLNAVKEEERGSTQDKQDRDKEINVLLGFAFEKWSDNPPVAIIEQWE